jgi:hypothetical protein
MGMYDYVKLAVPCPHCGGPTSIPQTKDTECGLDAVGVECVERMICHCRVCDIYFIVRLLERVHVQVEATEDHWDADEQRAVNDFQRTGHLEYVRGDHGAEGEWLLTWHDEQGE